MTQSKSNGNGNGNRHGVTDEKVVISTDPILSLIHISEPTRPY